MTALPDVRSMMGDVIGLLGRSITYRRIVPGAYNTTTFARADTPTDWTVNAVRNPSSTRTGGPKDALSHEFIIRATDLNTAAGSTYTPDANDRIVDDATVFKITRAERSADGLAWVISAQTLK